MPHNNSFTVLKIALICVGYYQNLEVSKTVRILMKLYCLLIGIWSFKLVYFVPNYVTFCVVVHHWFTLCVCILPKEPFLFKYYNQAVSFDYETEVAKTIFSKCSKFITTLFILIFLFAAYIKLIQYGITSGFAQLVNYDFESLVLAFLCEIGLQFAQGMSIAAIGILYCQVIVFESSLRKLGFVNAPHHVEIYYFINDSFSSVEQPVKIQAMVFISLLAVQLIFGTYAIIAGFVQLQQLFGTESLAKVLFIAGLQSLPVIILAILPFIIMELVANSYDEIKLYLQNQRIVCTNKRRQEKITALLHFVDDQPLRFTAWRMVSMDMRLVVGLCFGFVSYLVTALQMSHLFDNKTKS